MDGGIIRVVRNNTVVLGLGVPSLVCSVGVQCMIVEAEQGVDISGITFEAGYLLSDSLLQVGL